MTTDDLIKLEIEVLAEDTTKEELDKIVSNDRQRT